MYTIERRGSSPSGPASALRAWAVWANTSAYGRRTVTQRSTAPTHTSAVAVVMRARIPMRSTTAGRNGTVSRNTTGAHAASLACHDPHRHG
jgi:hypothetical protein